MANVQRKERQPTTWQPEPDGVPQFASGPHPFGPHEPDEADGIVVGGLRLVRTPDGTLLAVQEPKEPKR